MIELGPREGWSIGAVVDSVVGARQDGEVQEGVGVTALRLRGIKPARVTRSDADYPRSLPAGEQELLGSSLVGWRVRGAGRRRGEVVGWVPFLR